MAEEHPQHDGHAESEGHGHGGHGGGAHGGHGGGAHEEHEGAPEWLISFADNVALLMGFFVILLAMNMKEPQTGGIGGKDAQGGAPYPQDPRMLDMILSIRSAFNNPVSIDSTSPQDAALVKRLKDKKAKPTGKANVDAPLGDKREVQSVRPSSYKKVGAMVAFGDGSASISSEGVKAVTDIATKVRGKKWVIEVRGNASAAETFRNTARGYQLSYERAMAVAEVLVSNGVGWDQVRVVSCGDGDRVVPLAYSAAEHRPNQRAEVVITDDVVPDDPHTRDARDAGET